jgi:capsule biosynthesis phosphatase
MIKDNIYFDVSIINKIEWNCLGTPLQLKQFCNNYPKISCLNNKQMIQNLRICFDLDNTLVTYPKKIGDYTTVDPIEKNIEFLRYLKKFGNTIIIYTARRMKTHNGNIGKIMCDIGKITFNTLDKFNIPFDEIYFGKPYADVYIDDLGLNCFDNIEKKLGFYMDEIKTRDFNEIMTNTIETITKKSENLSGEIYYYNNIPKDIKDLFPFLFDYDVNNQWYKMEKIDGLICTNLYLSQLLTSNNLIHIMKSIKRIQDCKINIIEDINIYDNYSKKLKRRYIDYDYSKFENNDITYKTIYKQLLEYEQNDKGKLTIIHGDPVMTNIIINNHGKIKFIDMRGKVGNTNTILGDWLYDWAKLYQSLIGYDKILMNKEIDKNYEDSMIQTFKNYFIETFSEDDFINLKIITNSLLFTLIPLHDNNKCNKYYNLINFT